MDLIEYKPINDMSYLTAALQQDESLKESKHR